MQCVLRVWVAGIGPHVKWPLLMADGDSMQKGPSLDWPEAASHIPAHSCRTERLQEAGLSGRWFPDP